MRRSPAQRLAERVRALLTLAFTTDSEPEASVAFLKARTLNQRLSAMLPEDDDVTETRIQTAMLALDGERLRESPRPRFTGRRAVPVPPRAIALDDAGPDFDDFGPVGTPTAASEDTRATQPRLPQLPAQGYHVRVGED